MKCYSAYTRWLFKWMIEIKHFPHLFSSLISVTFNSSASFTFWVLEALFELNYISFDEEND